MAETDAQEPWAEVVTSDNLGATARHESGAVTVEGKLYLLGGRGIRPLEMFDPATSTWTNLGAVPTELHHFQPVAIGKKIYIVGAFACCYPMEELVSDIHVYNTALQEWSKPHSIPADRNRGGAAAVEYQNKIYLIGGNTLGHSGGAVAWFDEFDPLTGQWTTLADAPNARDHFGAVMIGDRLVASAGRQTAQPNPFANAVARTDIYDFDSGEWISTTDIPTLRAGAVVAAAGDEAYVIGGEIDTSSTALATVETFNPYTLTWRTLQPLAHGRHSGGAAVLGEQLHVVAGSLSRGGAPETNLHEMLQVDLTLADDSDMDGVSNSEELDLGTDPELADTDADGLQDGEELRVGTNPLEPDSDSDGLTDGEEIDMLLDPLNNDSDGDGIPDGKDPQPLVANSGDSGALSWLICALFVGVLARRRVLCVN